ncbi:MAG: cation:proton antiporter, partial [Planctomycetes bacterium]|nr:cation:proton antiporter [Planctomycetota bacterium]
MQHTQIISILVLLAMCFPIVLLTRRLGGSSLIAYLIVGALASNFDLVKINDIHSMAELGATLLLFSLGLELDLPAMRKHIGKVLVASLGQITFTIMIGTVAMIACGVAFNQSVIIGSCLALSSTLMVLRALDEHHLRNKDSGRTIIGILLAQDFAIAPLLIMISFLMPSSNLNTLHVIYVIVALILMTIFLRRFLASHLIRRIRGAQVPELEIAMSMCIALGAAMLTEDLGIGAAMGAFCAGLALGGDEHSHAIETSTRPLQGLVAIIFFASIGMQFNALYVVENYLLIAIALFVSVLVKSAIAVLA